MNLRTFLPLAFLGCLPATQAGTEPALRQAIATYDSAWSAKDQGAVAATMAPAFAYYSSEGDVTPREKMLGFLADSLYRVEWSERSELEPRIDGSVAVVASRWRGRGQWSGGRFDDDQRCSMTWRYASGSWQVLSEHCTQIKRGDSGEEPAVRAALQHYLNGHSSGSADEFKAGMNSRGTMYFAKDGALVTRSFPDFFAGAPGKPAADESKRRRRIDFVDITGTAAVAKITLEYPDVVFTDYMELLKIDGSWQIVAKSFHAVR